MAINLILTPPHKFIEKQIRIYDGLSQNVVRAEANGLRRKVNVAGKKSNFHNQTLRLI